MDKMGSDHPMGQSTGLHDLAGKEMSPRARKYLDQYSKKVKRLEDQIKRIPFVVLVWGPGEQGGALFEKRRQIKEKLLGDGRSVLEKGQAPGGSDKAHSFRRVGLGPW